MALSPLETIVCNLEPYPIGIRKEARDIIRRVLRIAYRFSYHESAILQHLSHFVHLGFAFDTQAQVMQTGRVGVIHLLIGIAGRPMHAFSCA